jgi:hypothetical protein
MSQGHRVEQGRHRRLDPRRRPFVTNIGIVREEASSHESLGRLRNPLSNDRTVAIPREIEEYAIPSGITNEYMTPQPVTRRTCREGGTRPSGRATRRVDDTLPLRL